MGGLHSPMQNQLLAAMPSASLDRLRPHLTLTSLARGQVLYESGSRMSHFYFPTTCIVSLLYALADGAAAEIAVIGKEGLVGVSLFMGGDTATSRAMVQSHGFAYQLPARLLKEEFQRGGTVQEMLLRYAQVLLTQAAQTAVCNRHHSVDQQLCRRLLLSLDRMLSNELMMTQELIASMLGVRREGITEAAGRLQDAGMIEYRRGRIRVLDRPALQSRCCECYAVVKAESERLLARTGTY